MPTCSWETSVCYQCHADSADMCMRLKSMGQGIHVTGVGICHCYLTTHTWAGKSVAEEMVQHHCQCSVAAVKSSMVLEVSHDITSKHGRQGAGRRRC